MEMENYASKVMVVSIIFKACGEDKIDDHGEGVRWLGPGGIGQSATTRGWTALWCETQSEPVG